MLTILRIRNFRFHFYSNEGNEPPHIHVRDSDGEMVGLMLHLQTFQLVPTGHLRNTA